MSTQKRLKNDILYKHIEYTSLEDKILQTKVFNRLLFVTQNALAYFAFPSINTKRYTHSLGTMYMASHMFKNAMLNAEDNTRNKILKKLKKSVDQIIKDEELNISIKTLNKYEDNSLYEYIVPLKSNSDKNIYLLILQALRIVGLLHDIGHFPFSHQVEYALQKIYFSIEKRDTLSEKERDFKSFYEEVTNGEDKILHEAIGDNLIEILFSYEMQNKNEYTKLVSILVRNILEEKTDQFFSYEVLHRFIDSTVDADRLDYVNRDMMASSYISGANDFLRITKQAVLIKQKDDFVFSFFDSEIIDIEHMLELRFNLYKKVIYSHKIARTDALLENVILYLASNYFHDNTMVQNELDSISMLWKFLDEPNEEKRLDIISQLDENWMISLFKQEYFKIKYKQVHSFEDKKYLISFEEVLFGKQNFTSLWKNLNDLYNTLGFDKIERYKFRESFGYVSEVKHNLLQSYLEEFCKKWEDEEHFLIYRIVSLDIGIYKNFELYDGESLIKLDEVSTLRKRLKKSILNTVPFYLYSTKEEICKDMKSELKEILFKVFL